MEKLKVKKEIYFELRCHVYQYIFNDNFRVVDEEYNLFKIDLKSNIETFSEDELEKKFAELLFLESSFTDDYKKCVDEFDEIGHRSFLLNIEVFELIVFTLNSFLIGELSDYEFGCKKISEYYDMDEESGEYLESYYPFDVYLFTFNKWVKEFEGV